MREPTSVCWSSSVAETGLYPPVGEADAPATEITASDINTMNGLV